MGKLWGGGIIPECSLCLLANGLKLGASLRLGGCSIDSLGLEVVSWAVSPIYS